MEVPTSWNLVQKIKLVGAHCRWTSTAPLGPLLRGTQRKTRIRTSLLIRASSSCRHSWPALKIKAILACDNGIYGACFASVSMFVVNGYVQVIDWAMNLSHPLVLCCLFLSSAFMVAPSIHRQIIDRENLILWKPARGHSVIVRWLRDSSTSPCVHLWQFKTSPWQSVNSATSSMLLPPN